MNRMNFQLGGFAGLILIPQTARTNIKTFNLSAHHDLSRMDIGQPAMIGAPLGMADPVTVL
jgi:hypothetical protein